MSMPDATMGVSEEKFVPRVTQLDAVELDNEVIRVVKSQVVTASKYFKIGILDQWEPEIDAAIRLLIWKYSVNRLYGTFGQQLLSVKYAGSFNKNKALLYACITVGSKYVKDRSSEISQLTGGNLSQATLQILDWAESGAQIAAFINLLLFLREGKYPTLTDRLLGLRPVSTTGPGQNRAIGYTYMLRELLWHGFIELLVFTLPLINYHYLRRKCVDFFTWQKNKDVKKRPVVFTTRTKCAVCKETPILPHTMGCSHMFCFYCIKANHLADPKFECPVCGFSPENAEAIKPFQVSVC